MKHDKYFADFLSNCVNLNESRLNTLKQSVESITGLLKSKLSNYRKYSEQGSYSHKTIIKPVQDSDEFDADILVFIKDNSFNPNNFITDYVDMIYNILKANEIYRDKISKNTRCVTVDYAGDFHLDIVPCIEYNGICYICNRKDRKYEKTDGDGYKHWLIKKNQVVGNNSFRKVTRLLKFLRDHKNTFSIKSILLTTILGNTVNECDPNEFSDFPTTLKILSSRINNFLQSNKSMPIIDNPVMCSENFNRHWDESKYINFKVKFKSYNIKIMEAFEELDHNKSVKKWRELFGNKFGCLVHDSKNSSEVSSVSIPTVSAKKPYASYD